MKLRVPDKLSLIIVVLVAALALFGGILSPFDPLTTRPDLAFMPPDRVHLLGTDEVGRDILSRMLTGAGTTIGIGVLATALACCLGTVLGMLAGYGGGFWDLVISQLINVALAFPSLLLAIGISIVLPPGAWSVVIALCLAGWADFARLVRSQTLELRDMEFVQAARVLGTRPLRIGLLHLLPGCASLLIVSTSLKLGSYMLAEAGLSFLGLGIPAPYPTLGGMIATGREYLIVHPWIPLFPGLLIAVIVLSCNLLGELMQARFNPKTPL